MCLNFLKKNNSKNSSIYIPMEEIRELGSFVYRYDVKRSDASEMRHKRNEILNGILVLLGQKEVSLDKEDISEELATVAKYVIRAPYKRTNTAALFLERVLGQRKAG